MEPELIQISVAGPAVLASVASGLQKTDSAEHEGDADCVTEANETVLVEPVSEKNLKNT